MSDTSNVVDKVSSDIAIVCGIPCISLAPLDTYINYKTPAALWVPIKYWDRLRNFSDEINGMLRKLMLNHLQSYLIHSSYQEKQYSHFGTWWETIHQYDFTTETKIVVLVAESFQKLSSLSSTLFPHVTRMFNFAFTKGHFLVDTHVCVKTAVDQSGSEKLDTIFIIVDAKSILSE